MKTQYILFATALTACLTIAKDVQPPAPVAEIAKVETTVETPLVQIAVLLDTSSSWSLAQD